MSTRCYLVATSPHEVLVMAAAWRAGSLPVAGPLVLVVGTGTGSRAARRTAEQLGFVERVVVLDELLGGDGRVEDSPVELVVGSASLEAGRALARRLLEVSITLVAVDGDAYGPTPDLVRGRFARLVSRVLHLDIVPGLTPLLLAERHVPAAPVPLDDLRALAATLPAALLPDGGRVVDPTTLVLGSAARWDDALDADRQTDLLVALVQRCAEAGHSRMVLLLDPRTRPRVRRQLEKAAAQVRADLTVVDDQSPAEQWLATGAVRFVVGSAAPDLVVAQAAYGIRAAQLDTDVVLKRLAPFSDPRRIGATLVQALVPDLRSWTSAPEGEAPPVVDLPGLVTAVAYAMQPELLAGHRPAVIEHLATVEDGTRRRFVRRRRLGELRLPGGKRKVRATLG
ncbi:hypothetical protein SAMN04488544_4072 [Microlunatus sagamiharensis]|uniref:Uncharacterized protein n=1 Tax=Microlunatus sagamiharensis TaxID=546874 RepID=A0A1H2NJH7_9ACTN|nr:hypothetical protein [Microlunatus sagamiharensis]SDV04956.1 hypothetical protein SAMN04488544_4072 [Microlunatus sagamiharensis]